MPHGWKAFGIACLLITPAEIKWFWDPGSGLVGNWEVVVIVLVSIFAGLEALSFRLVLGDQYVSLRRWPKFTVTRPYSEIVDLRIRERISTAVIFAADQKGGRRTKLTIPASYIDPGVLCEFLNRKMLACGVDSAAFKDSLLPAEERVTANYRSPSENYRRLRRVVVSVAAAWLTTLVIGRWLLPGIFAPGARAQWVEDWRLAPVVRALTEGVFIFSWFMPPVTLWVEFKLARIQGESRKAAVPWRDLLWYALYLIAAGAFLWLW